MVSPSIHCFCAAKTTGSVLLFLGRACLASSMRLWYHAWMALRLAACSGDKGTCTALEVTAVM